MNLPISLLQYAACQSLLPTKLLLLSKAQWGEFIRVEHTLFLYYVKAGGRLYVITDPIILSNF